MSRIVDTVVEGEAFRDYETVWGIQAFSDVPLGRFKYGEVPDGWREAIPPKPLEAGALYSVGEYWFRLNPGPPVTWTLERGRPPEGSPTT